MNITDRVRQLLPPIHGIKAPDDPLVILKFYLPGSKDAWYVTGGEPEMLHDHGGLVATGGYLFFGYVVDHEEGLNYFTLEDLNQIKRRGKSVERDQYWTPVPLSKVISGEVR